jgi:murein DD-endopeptidase MepM/ murein hydrolase activator NlpD
MIVWLFLNRSGSLLMRNAAFYTVFVFFTSCSLLQNSRVVYQLDKTLADTTYAYSLPFQKSTSQQVWQGYHSVFSHYGNLAVDFKMKPGTPIHAARGGVVVHVVEENKRGGVGLRYIGKENSIIIQHSDSTFAHYLHLKYKGAVVNVGDTVQEGQQIGLSGHTGFSAFPHLHFEVTKGLRKAKDEVPVRFKTEKGVMFLQPLHRYKAV